MSKFKELILNALTAEAENIEEAGLEIELTQLMKDDPEGYKTAVAGALELTSKLLPKVKSKFLHAMLEGINVAIQEVEAGINSGPDA